MFYKSRPQIFPIKRKTLIAISPIIFLLLLIVWTLFNIGLSPVKAAASNPTFAIVRRASANIRRGPGIQYGIWGTVKKGALLPVSGQYVNAFGERWYKVYLRAFGDAWVSGVVVEISPANANIPVVGLTSAATAESTGLPEAIAPQNSSSNSNSGGNNPPSNPPATTPDPGA